MTVRVLLFASYADVLGATALELELPPEATVADLVKRVRERPGAALLPARPLVAVNRSYATYDQPVRPTDEVALIPPVAGG